MRVQNLVKFVVRIHAGEPPSWWSSRTTAEVDSSVSAPPIYPKHFAVSWPIKAGGLWTARQVIATLRNPVYLGLFRDGGSFRSGNHEPIVEKELFDAAAERLESRRTRQPGKRLAIELPLKGLLRCAACEKGHEPAHGPEGTSRLPLLPVPLHGWRAVALRRPGAAYAIETAVQRKLSKRTGANVDLNEIGNRVESIIYDAGPG